MATLTFTNFHDLHFPRTVEDGTEDEQLELFTKGHVAYAREWIEVDGGRWIHSDAIVAVRIAGEPAAPVG